MKSFTGLTTEEAERSRREHGANILERERQKGFFGKFLENLGDPIIKILLFALILEVVFTLGKCNLLEVGGIVIAILISTTVSTVSELGSEKAFSRMSEESGTARSRVLRDGKACELPSSEIVVGDIVSVSAGEKIQADGRIISGEITVDQSALNGESREVGKRPGTQLEKWELSDPALVFHGSTVTSGTALMEVGRIGKSTFYGGVAHDVQVETRESPLRLRLSRLAKQISRIGYVMAVFVALTYLFFELLVDNGFVIEKILQDISDYPALIATLIHALTLMITVIVVAVPEGLPMMITVVLSANMKRMLADNILIKKLVGIETAGSMNILFTDKTGTLTTGKMECDRILTASGAYKSLSHLERSGEIYNHLVVSAKYNTDTAVSPDGAIGGNATDRAVAEFFLNSAAPEARVTDKTAFDSKNKYSSVTLDGKITYFKGAAEIILKKCSSALTKNGDFVVFDFSPLFLEYSAATKRGERAIAVAISKNGEMKDMTFLGIIFLKDKLRPGIKEAVADVTSAGIQTVILTGDSRETAVAIAAECGIFREKGGHIAITSEELSLLRDDELREILPLIRVVARALPSDKTRLVRVSQSEDMVVGMTGDGINDAPSLKLADVGFAMGSGTDIAKSAGDVVILDDSFSAIAKTVLYGRTIFKSIRKFITFQLIMNLAACGVSILGQLIGIESPITIIQMLWINVIMDTLGGLAFAGEAPLSYYMKEKPKRRDEPILSFEMLGQIAFLGGYTLTLCCLFLRLNKFREIFGVSQGEGRFLTAFYALFVFLGLFNCFLARSERLYIFSNIGKNKPFILIMLLIFTVQLVMIYFGGTLFRTVPISARDISVCLLLSSTTVMFEIARRIFIRLK